LRLRAPSLPSSSLSMRALSVRDRRQISKCLRAWALGREDGR
jgi:hypothetical protein